MYDAVDWYVADFDIPANLPRTWLLTLGGQSAANDVSGIKHGEQSGPAAGMRARC